MTSAISICVAFRRLVIHRITWPVLSALASAMKHLRCLRRPSESSPHCDVSRSQRVDICDAAFALDPLPRQSIALPRPASARDLRSSIRAELRCLGDPSHHFSTCSDTLTSAIGHPCRNRRPGDSSLHPRPLRPVGNCDVVSGPKWPQDGSRFSIAQGFSLLHFQPFSTRFHNRYAQQDVQLT